jgi:hypothetical protein
MAEAYHRECLRCGGSLYPVAQGPEIPPWVCPECLVFYWVAELTQEARQSYRHAQHDFGWLGTPEHTAVERAKATEREKALLRGVSVRQEQLGLVPKEDLKALHRRHQGRLSTNFEGHLQQQLKKRVQKRGEK